MRLMTHLHEESAYKNVSGLMQDLWHYVSDTKHGHLLWSVFVNDSFSFTRSRELEIRSHK